MLPAGALSLNPTGGFLPPPPSQYALTWTVQCGFFATVNSVLCVLLCYFSRQTFLASLLLSSNCTSSTCTLARRRPTKTHRPLAVIDGASCSISLLSYNSSSVMVAYFISVLILCVNGSFIYVYGIPVYCIFCDDDNCYLTSDVGFWHVPFILLFLYIRFHLFVFFR